jgi:NACHT domain
MEKIDMVLSDIERVRETTIFPDPRTAEARFEEAYRRQVARKLDEIELYGAADSVASSSRRHNLTQAYISLDVLQYGRSQRSNTASPSPSMLRQQDSGESTTQSARVDALLAHAPRLVIRGEAGSGKTTLLQYVAVRCATASCEGSLESLNNYIPFVIRLRQLPEKALPRPEEFPALVASTIADTMPPGWVHNILRQGIGLILIDGVDEVVEDRRSDVREWVKDLVVEFVNCRFLVTSRPSAIRASWLSSEGFTEAELLPMQPKDVESFIDAWHVAVGQEETDEDRKVNLPDLANSLKQRLRTDSPLRELAATPLICAMICAMHRGRRTVLPTNRIALYEAALAMLLHRRDLERRLIFEDLPALEYEEKDSLLQELAIWSMENGWSSVEEGRAVAKIGTVLPAFSRLPGNTSPEGVLRSLLLRSGILRSPTDGSIEFIHKTFQEFLCAKALVTADRILSLVDRVHNDRWREVAALACGLADEVRREEFLNALISKGDRSGQRQTIFYLIAVACLETSVRLSPDLQQNIAERIKKMHPPETKTEAKILSGAGDLALPLVLPRSGQRATCAAACVRALRLIGSDSCFSLLREYASDRRATVTEEVISGWNNFDRERYAELVLSQSIGIRGSLHLENPTNFRGLQYLKRILRLSIFDNRKIISTDEYDEISKLTNLRVLRLYNWHVILPSLEFLRELGNLIHLEIVLSKAEETSQIGLLSNLQALRANLDIGNSGIIAISKLTKLLNLELTLSDEVSDLTPLSAIKSLRTLSVDRGRVCKWQPLPSISGLTRLRLTRVPHIDDLAPIGACKGLNELVIQTQGTGVGNLELISQLGNLQDLDLNCNHTLIRLHNLSNLKKLKRLCIAGPTRITDVNFFLDLPDLEQVVFPDLEAIDDPGALRECPNLKRLVVPPAVARAISGLITPDKMLVRPKGQRYRSFRPFRPNNPGSMTKRVLL